MKLPAWKTVLLAGTLLIATYFFLPNDTAQNVLYAVLGLGSVLGILFGIHRHHPANRIGWYFVAAAGVCYTLGDNLLSLYTAVHINIPFPSYADAFYLAGYPFLFAGVLRLTRDLDRSSWRENNADAAIVSIGVLAISWQFLMDSYAHDATLTNFGMLVNLAYPMMDVALVFIVFRTILFKQSRFAYLNFLAAAMLVMFVADFIYDLLTLHNSYQTGNFVDALFLSEYVLVAAAALHPSMASAEGASDTSKVGVERGPSSGRNRLPVVMVAGFIAPAILVVATALHRSVNVLALSLFCILAFAVIGLRLKWMIDRMNRQSVQLQHNLTELTVAHLHRDELEADLRRQTLHDPLTGLANRMLFEDRLSQARERSLRQGGLDAVLMLDLDDFKGVNDAYSHFVGDQLLVAVSRRLNEVTRSSDTLCRLGGDEFLYLAEGIADRATAEAICDRLIEALCEPFVFGDVRFEQHASIGAVICDAADETNAEYVRDADAAMYEAKRRHKGHYVVFTPSMHHEALSIFSLTQDLRTAFQKSELTMYYQPIIELSSSRIVGFEALMRWPHVTRGFVSPDVFIPIAERSELILELGNFALRDAASVVGSWERSDAASSAPFVTVNLSPRQLHDADLIPLIKSILAANVLAPERLIIEITERAALVDIDDTLDVIERLRNLGVAMALDDFGTGYSSLSYITLLQPKIIKIDRSFVAPAHQNRDSEALLEAIISLGQKLGIIVLAEGIETTTQFDRLRQLGCELGQGFLFSPAVAASEVPALLGYVPATPTGGRKRN